MGERPAAIKGLRVGGLRAVRAKFPNGNPELSGQWFMSTDPGMGAGAYSKGWVQTNAGGTRWVTPADKQHATTEIVVNGNDWPSAHWPSKEEGRPQPWTGEGDWGDFHIGSGGFCDDIYPPTGYWCSMAPPRGQCWPVLEL